MVETDGAWTAAHKHYSKFGGELRDDLKALLELLLAKKPVGVEGR